MVRMVVIIIIIIITPFWQETVEPPQVSPGRGLRWLQGHRMTLPGARPQQDGLWGERKS